MAASEPGANGRDAGAAGDGAGGSPLLLAYVAADGLAVLAFVLAMILGWYEGDARALMFVHVAVIVALSAGLPAVLRRLRAPGA